MGGCGFFTDADLEIVEDLGAAVTSTFRGTAGTAKASSARACMTLLLRDSCFGSEGGVTAWANSNFCPRSCNNENSSSEGNRAASSSAASLRTCTF